MNRRLVIAACASIATLLLGACGIQAESAPRDVPLEDQNLNVVDASTGSDASGADRIFLIGPGEERLLESVPRDAESDRNLIEILLLGPNAEELDAQFSSAIPPGIVLRSTRAQGPFFYIDLGDEITELTGQGLIRALAQFVYTASEIDGIDAVVITVNGENLSWPRGNGDSSPGPLRTYDYPGLAQSAQPAYPAIPSGA